MVSCVVSCVVSWLATLSGTETVFQVTSSALSKQLSKMLSHLELENERKETGSFLLIINGYLAKLRLPVLSTCALLI